MPFERFPKDGPWGRGAARLLIRGSWAGWLLVGYELWNWAKPSAGGMVVPPGWNYIPGCEDPPDFYSSLLSSLGCIRNQAGPTDTGVPPFVIQRAVTGRRRWGAGAYQVGSLPSRADHMFSYWADFYPPSPHAAPLEEQPTDVPRYEAARPMSWPTYSLGWAPMLYPDWSPVAPGFITQPETPPLGAPKPLNPGTKQWPEVGPLPDTVPWPGLEPYQPPVPQPVIRPTPDGGVEVNPEAEWKPDHSVSVSTRGRFETRPRPNKLPKRPPRGTKERKVRMGRVMGAIWRGISPITEFADTVDVMYECLPWLVKVKTYQRRGRQPGTAEKVALIYRHINELDMSCVVTGFIAEQVEDMFYGAIGRLEAGANQRNPFGRPLGYGAGWAL